MPRLVYVKAPGAGPRAAADPSCSARIQAESGASYDAVRRTPAELADLVADDLAVLLTERFTARRRPRPPPGWRARLAADAADPAGRPAGRAGHGDRAAARPAGAAGDADRAGRHRQDPAGAGRGAELVGRAGRRLVRRPGPGARTRRRAGAIVAAAVGVAGEGRRPVLDLVADRLAGRRVAAGAGQPRAGAPARARAGPAARPLPAHPAAGHQPRRCCGCAASTTSRSGRWPSRRPPTSAGGGGRRRRRPAVRRPGAARPTRRSPSPTRTRRRWPSCAAGWTGCPLAVELAAARVRTLPPPALLRRLGDAPLGTLALDLAGGDVDLPDRQRTLRATDRLEPRPARRRPSGRCSPGCRCAPAAAPWTRPRRSAPSTATSTSSSRCPRWSSTAWSPPTTAARASRGSGCWRWCARSPRSGCASAARRTPTRERLARHLAAGSAAAGAGSVGRRPRAVAGPAGRRVRRPAWARCAGPSAATTRSWPSRLAAPLARWWWARGLLPAMADLADAPPRCRRRADAAAGRRRPAALGAGADPDRPGPGATRARRCSPRWSRTRGRGTTRGCSGTGWPGWR